MDKKRVVFLYKMFEDVIYKKRVMTKSKKEESRSTILVLGVSGMVGHKVFEVLSASGEYLVVGTVTKFGKVADLFPSELKQNVIEGVYAEDLVSVEKILITYKPSILINCLGIIKQKAEGVPITQYISVNALFPHQVAGLCDKYGAKLITLSTDCVFDGKKGGSYFEIDVPTCHDVYGMSKYLGEIPYGNHLTLRTSIIGHEVLTSFEIVDWFLGQKDFVRGYKKAIFSGLTTVELSKLLLEKILKDKELCGLHHISVTLISKFDLLKKISKVYRKNIKITPDEKVDINRALDSENFKKQIGYTAPTWDKLINDMYADFLRSPFYNYKRKLYGGK